MLNTDTLVAFDSEREKNARLLFMLTPRECQSPSGPPSGQTPADEVPLLPDAIPQSLRALARMNRFQGKVGQVLANEDGVLVGTGPLDDPLAIAAAAETLPDADYRIGHPAMDAQRRDLTTLGWLLGGYRFTRYRKDFERTARLIAPAGCDVDHVKRTAGAISFVRDLVNTPADDMGPSHLEATARDLAETYRAAISVTHADDLLERNFPLVHAVGRAAADGPRLIDMTWRPEGSSVDLPSLTLIGKGVCFDSGGLNIKGASGMVLMKKDMGGAAHALGLAQMIMDAGLPVRLRVLIPAVENAISGCSFRPGDVLSSRNGLTVEIGNTDAEGRLILADAMTLAAEERPDLIITLATLTGAARVALGPEVIPFYTDDVELAQAMKEASADTQDPAWHMPLWPRYDSMLASPVADLNNISGNSFAGSIIAGLFLRRFIPFDQRWMHLDLYAWRPTTEPGRPQGGEAQCLRALFTLISGQVSG